MHEKILDWKLTVYCFVSLLLGIFYLLFIHLFGKAIVGSWGLSVCLLAAVLFLCLLLLKGKAAKVTLRVFAGIFCLAHIPPALCWIFMGGIVGYLWAWPIGILLHAVLCFWSLKICLGHTYR